jgi:putative heme iron utilization protein
MEKRTEYVERLSAQMVEWDAQIDRIKIQATSATAESGHGYAGAIAALQAKRDEAALKLQGISTAGDDEWEDLKTGTEQIWGDFTTMLGNAIKKTK